MKLGVATFNRNDGYKEDERLLIHILSLLESFDEINYIDWNSPDQSMLYNIIDDIPKTGKIRHYVIPSSFHELLTGGSDDIPSCLAPFAFNLALRRSNTDWFAVTTVDNVPPSRNYLETFITNSKPDTFYTFSRREINFDDVYSNRDSLFEYVEKMGEIIPPRYMGAKVTPNDHYSIINCCGDFQFAPLKIWHDIKGLEEKMIFECFVDTNVQKKAVLNGYNLEAIFDIPIFHMSHKNKIPQADGGIEKLHEVVKNKTPIYNDAFHWVEHFKESENDDNWGLNNIEIEYEVI